MSEYRKPDDSGHWEGDVFHFSEPINIQTDDGFYVMRTLDLSGVELENGVTRGDVIHVMLNPVSPAELDSRPPGLDRLDKQDSRA